jgi:hypothetical protein
VDRHVLGAVVLEDAPDVGGLGDQDEVAQEDPDADQALDQVLDESVRVASASLPGSTIALKYLSSSVDVPHLNSATCWWILLMHQINCLAVVVKF